MGDWRDTLPVEIQRSFADNQADEAAAWLSLAVKQGVVDARIHPFDDDNFPIELLPLTIAEAEWVGSSYHPDLYAEQTSRRNVESILPLVTHPNVAEYWAIELARVLVPDDQIGFLDSLEQVLLDSNGNYYPTSQDYWGSPYSVIPDVSGCRWYLKTQDIDSFDATRINFTNAAAIDPYRQLPGAPYANKFVIDGTWYPAHSATARDLNWLIPANSVLRFYMISPPLTVYEWQAAGRLRATVQSALSEQAVDNARRLP